MNKEEMFDDVVKKVGCCKLCSLAVTRKYPVIGDGSLNAKLFFIGEAPGEEEDKLGLPFMGEAGQVLNKLFESIGLERRDVYIANILKCRPLKNAVPTNEETRLCSGYLEAQISLINPSVIITLGKTATIFIMEKYGLGKEFTSITNVKGKVFNVANPPLKILPLFHPAVAVYEPSRFNELKKDFSKIKEVLK